jgi:hypothetical protein
MLDYYRKLEEFTNQVAMKSPLDEAQRRSDINDLTALYNDAVLADLQACVDRATKAIGAKDEAARARAELVSTGLEYTRRTRDLLAAAAKVRAKRSTAAEFAPINAATQAYYKTLALGWAVSIDHNYSYIRRGLSLRPGQVAGIADPDAP